MPFIQEKQKGHFGWKDFDWNLPYTFSRFEAVFSESAKIFGGLAVKSPYKETGLGNRGRLKVPNDSNLILND